MRICLIGSILKHHIQTVTGEVYSGWGGCVESAVAPLSCLLDSGSIIFFVGHVGIQDYNDLVVFFHENYPMVNTEGIIANDSPTDIVYVEPADNNTTKSRVSHQTVPTSFTDVQRFVTDVDATIINFANIDDIDDDIIQQVYTHTSTIIYVDVHRKIYAADAHNNVYKRGWTNWERHLSYADIVQMNHEEAGALLDYNIETINDAIVASRIIVKYTDVVELIITLGNQGVLLNASPSGHRKLVHIPAVKSVAIDTTGCGDAFGAAYLTGRLNGRSPLESAKFANAVAAKTSCVKGYIHPDDFVIPQCYQPYQTRKNCR